MRSAVAWLACACSVGGALVLSCGARTDLGSREADASEIVRLADAQSNNGPFGKKCILCGGSGGKMGDVAWYACPDQEGGACGDEPPYEIQCPCNKGSTVECTCSFSGTIYMSVSAMSCTPEDYCPCPIPQSVIDACGL